MGHCKKICTLPNKEMIYIKKRANSKKKDHYKTTLRKHIAEVLGVIKELLRTKILNANKTAEQLSTHTLQQFLAKKGYNFSRWRLVRVLHKLGFYYEGQNDVSHRPGVFLDESYCHLHHNSRNIWVPHHGIILTPRHGLLVDPIIKPPSNRRRKRNNAEEWNDVPNVVKEANIVPNQVNYHGNFTAEIFEDLFSILCKTLHEKYGLAKKQEIIDWLNAHDIAFSDELRKPELLELRRALKNAKEYFEFDKNIQLIDDEFDAYSTSDEDYVT
ncbi:hypothetical protein H257_11777 [Rhizophagus clarus]|uniref:Winged helix-turn helix domain-containing protein n=1 Tax=Rhizophagus clarus TaxID=94130 RepID=A0A8H3KW94_9GLOM|nr:hypothetical protein H257_11777 [Rhizophagus clarus]